VVVEPEVDRIAASVFATAAVHHENCLALNTRNSIADGRSYGEGHSGARRGKTQRNFRYSQSTTVELMFCPRHPVITKRIRPFTGCSTSVAAA
jgi:hypothetical protein